MIHKVNTRQTVGILLLAIYGLISAACTEPESVGSEYERAVIQSRIAKDIQFFDPDATVMRSKELAEFTGLRYFPVDSTRRYVVAFERLENPSTVLISKQKSAPIPYQHIGFVAIPGPDTTVSLSVFWSREMNEGTGWLPFTDATSNVETYGGGRYLDVELREDGFAVVDFNKASNPFCVYNPYDYNCAIPPASNRLPFRMPAGEKKVLLMGG